MDSKSKKNSTSGSQVVTPTPDPVTIQEPKVGRKKFWKKCCHRPTKKTWVTVAAVVLGILAVVTVFKSIGVIAVSILTAIATKHFSDGHSGKIAALIVVCISAAVGLSISIYALVALFTKKIKPITYAGAVLMALAVIQLIVLSSTLLAKDSDQSGLDQELTDSFRQALEHNPRQSKNWDVMQSALKCCGLYSPEDYRALNLPVYFAPEVPISCCPGYDPSRSAILQERERETCRAKKDYHKPGCLHPVKEALYNSTVMEQQLLIGFIVLEVITAAAALVVAKLRRKAKDEDEDDDEEAK